MNSTFLLEIGTEELPADFARLALAQLDRIVAHEIQILEIYRLLGLLFVSEEGMIIS